MGWEERNGRSYYYRKERTPEGVRSVYVGSGPVAELAAEYEEIEGERERLERDRLRRALAPYDDALAALRDEAARLRTLARAYLVATGHRAHRGQWRRARHLRSHLEELRADAGPLTLPANQPPAAMARKKKASVNVKPGTTWGTENARLVTIPEGLDEQTAAELASAAEACNMEKPEPGDVTRFREALRRLPASAFGPFVDREARRSAAALFCGSVNSSVAFAENEAERFADELAGPFPGPLVQAAAEHAATARLVLGAVQAGYSGALRGTYSLKVADSWERRLNAASRRYVRALGAVALLRRAEETEARGAGVPTPAERAALAERAREELDRRAAVRALPQHAGDSIPAPEEVEVATA